MEKKSYLLGILGGILGVFVACIPWILMYVYGEMILSALAVVIALGVLKGYQLFKGKVDKKLPVIIIVISCICVTVSTLVLIPCLLLSSENISINTANLNKLYNYDPFMTAMIKDYVISLLFTFLGIAGVVKNIKKQIEEGKTDNIKVEFNDGGNSKEAKKEYEKIKKKFLKLNAIDKYSGVEKEQIECDKRYFNFLKNAGIIKKYQGKYYYSEKDEKRPFIRFIKIYIKVFILLAVIVVGMIGLILVLS